MPQNVRNFWVEGNIDGRGPVNFGGPKARDGGFEMTVYQRDEGDVTVALRLAGRALSDGRLVLDVQTADHYSTPDQAGRVPEFLSIRTRR